MVEIPRNDGDNAKSRIDKFVEYVMNALKERNSVKVLDYFDGNPGDVPGITYHEAKELARLFAAKGYHAGAYFIDVPAHGFRWVTISKSVCYSSDHPCSHTERWA